MPCWWACCEPLGDLRDDSRGGFLPERADAADELAQVGAGHVLRHQEIDVAVMALVQRADQLAMVKLGRGLDFAVEVGDRLGRGFVAGQDLDGHDPRRDLVLGLEDLTHAPLAE